ncbi:MAG: hypothetical protein OEU26_14105 [Candidatus Tectomicrobia bacterium]|nr:hypothetical protein [Candidatus Tectomicrobia bacterium]
MRAWCQQGLVAIVGIFGVGSALALASAQDSSLGMRVAQTEAAVLAVTAGGQNSTRLVDVSGSTQDLSALQVVLTATGEAVSVDNVAIGLGRIDRDATLGDEGLFDNLHVRLIDDLNANAVLDAGETVLGTQTLEELEDENPETVLITLSPPLTIAAGSSTTLLAIIDINRPDSQSAQATPPPHRERPLRHSAWALSFLPIFGLLMRYAWPARFTQRYLPFLLLILCLGMMVPGCSGGNDGELYFIVNLPSNGLTNQGNRLGPATAISGITVRLTN